MGMRLNQAGNQASGQGMSTTLSDEEKKKKEQESPQEPQIPQLKSPSSQIGVAPTTAPKAAPKQQAAGTGTFSNLKSYIQAAQGGGQQKIAQAASQKVQNVASGAQKEISQSQKTFGNQLEAGTLANRGTAGEDVQAAIKAARNVTYQAPQVPQATQEVVPSQEPSTVPQTPVTSAPVEVTPEQAQRFQEIINARYAGPGSIQEAGLYTRAAEKARTAQEAVKQTQTAAGREQLLRNIFSQGRDYSRGQSKLDALLLNTSQQGLGQLQQQAQQAGDLQQNLQQAQTESANTATGRAKEISDIQQQARKSFLEGRTEEETTTEKGIDALIKDPALDASGSPIPKLDSTGKPMVDPTGKPVYQTKWDQLPEYYREAIRNKETTNEAIQKERLAALTTYDPQVQQLTNANNQIAATDAEINKVKVQINRLRNSGKRNDVPIQIYNQQLRKLQQQSSDQKAQAAAIQQSPEYQQYTQQKAAANQMNMNQLSLSPEEAAVLGISSGEGLYNVGQDLIKDVNAERGRLITKDQFARQQALARLAGLDTSKALQKDLQYTDAEKAGTQTLKSSLNTQAVRDILNEKQQQFKESAEGANLVGMGKKKVSRGNWSGTRTKTYYADQSGNVADMLRQAGYDVSAESPEATRTILSDKDALANYLGATDTGRDDSGSMYAEGAARTATGAATGATIGAGLGAIGGPLAGVTAAGGAVVGGILGSVVGPNSSLSNVVGDLSGGRMSSSAMAKVGRGTAKAKAIEDLERKYKAYLEGQGFGNRSNIVDAGITSTRSAALRDLLRRQG